MPNGSGPLITSETRRGLNNFSVNNSTPPISQLMSAFTCNYSVACLDDDDDDDDCGSGVCCFTDFHLTTHSGSLPFAYIVT